MDMQRRLLLSCSSIIAASALLPRVAFATVPGRQAQRFVLVIMRGAMDGLASVPPVGDVDYASTHGQLSIAQPGQPDGALPLDGRFGLHPALAAIHPMFASGELLLVHAMASPYRQRSHFDAQNLLENGTDHPNGTDGWLNRTLTELGADRWSALAVGPTVPLVLTGKAPVSNWKPETETLASSNLMLSVSHMYENDPALSSALSEGMRSGDMIDGAIDGGMGNGGGRRVGGNFPQLAEATGKILAAPDGPNVAVLEVGGWDTHVGQGSAKGRLSQALTPFAEGLAKLKAAMGPRWADTVVVAVTEFGRTAKPNGTQGTDHGTGTAGFVLGGKVNGGRVHADWPGLSNAALYQQRDLAPTTDMRSLIKSVLGDHLKVSARSMDTVIFPGSQNAKPLKGLLKA